MKEFELTDEHLKLLRRTHIRWSQIEYGAPGIDDKRPYGNSAVIQDIAEILGYHLGEHPYDQEKVEELERLHRETETALKIVLHNQSFETGTYICQNDYGSGWEKKHE